MSFKVNWPKFSPDFLAQAREQLSFALNKGEKPPNIVDTILVNELNMGTKPPELEILEIGDLAEERFRGIFKLTYSGDSYVVLQTKVQANPLNLPKFRCQIRSDRDIMLAANLPLIVPMRLRISNLKLRGIIVLVVDKVKGITLVFKNDPLEKVDVNSTFDNIPNIRRFLQSQIEGQLRKMFQDDLPQLIHKLSLVLIQKKNAGGGDDDLSKDGSASSNDGTNGSTNMRRSGANRGSVSFGPRRDDADDNGEEERVEQRLEDRLEDRLEEWPRRRSHGGKRYNLGSSDSSADSGYQDSSEDYDSENTICDPDYHLTNRPHSQKWTGNEPVELDSWFSSDTDAEAQTSGYVMYRALRVKDSLTTPGLQCVTQLDDLNDSRSTTSTASSSRHVVTRPVYISSSPVPSSTGGVAPPPPEDTVLPPPYASPRPLFISNPHTSHSPNSAHYSYVPQFQNHLHQHMSTHGIHHNHHHHQHHHHHSHSHSGNSSHLNLPQFQSGNWTTRSMQRTPSTFSFDARSEYTDAGTVLTTQSSPLPRRHHTTPPASVDVPFSPTSNGNKNGSSSSSTANTPGSSRRATSIILQPSANPLAARLANLMHVNHTMSPHVGIDTQHVAFRTHPASPSSPPLTPVSATTPRVSGSRRRVGTRTVRVVRLPQGMASDVGGMIMNGLGGGDGTGSSYAGSRRGSARSSPAGSRGASSDQ